MNEGEKSRAGGLKDERRTGRRTGRSGDRDLELDRERSRTVGMSERIASCGSLYDSTNLLLQYCNNGETLICIMTQQNQNQNQGYVDTHRKYTRIIGLISGSEVLSEHLTMFLKMYY